MPSTDVPHRYLVCYDVPDARRRVRLAKCLDDFGTRVQYSVFEVVLDRLLFDKLVDQLTARIDPHSDRVNIYPVCAACQRRAVFLGLSAGEERPGLELVFVV
jgi:CRISPR-associated protein Cas2